MKLLFSALALMVVVIACTGPEADILRLVPGVVADGAAANDASDASDEAAADATTERDGGSVADAGVDACTGKDLRTDSDHCGACFHGCLGGACTDGGCQPVLVTTATSPVGIAVDDDRAFFASSTPDGGVFSVRKDGADKQPIVGGLALPQRITVAGSYVLYSTVGAPGVVGRAEKSGALARVLATTNGSPGQIVVDGNDVFFVDQYNAAIRKMPLDGVPDAGAPAPFANGIPYAWGLAIAGADLVWSSRGTFVAGDGGPGGFTAADGVIYAAPKDGSAMPRILAGAQKEPLGVAADTTGIYWVNARGNELLKLAPGASAPTLVASGLPAPWGLTMDDTHVYITCIGFAAGEGSVVRVRKDGTTPIDVLVSALFFPSTITNDERAVYWTNTHGGTVMKIAK